MLTFLSLVTSLQYPCQVCKNLSNPYLMAGTTEKLLYGEKMTDPSPRASQLETELKAEAPVT